MTSPPMGVRLVCEAVCVLKGIKPQRIADPGGTGMFVLSTTSTPVCVGVLTPNARHRTVQRIPR